MTALILMPLNGSGPVAVPALIAAAGERASVSFLEFWRLSL
jgi:hypothetical protein